MGSPGRKLQWRLGSLVCDRVLPALAPVLNRARLLSPKEQVMRCLCLCKLQMIEGAEKQVQCLVSDWTKA